MSRWIRFPSQAGPSPNRMRMTGDVGMVATSTTQSIDYSLAIGQNKPAGWSAGEPKRCLLIGGVDHLHTAVLGGEWVGWVFKLLGAIPNSHQISGLNSVFFRE